MLLGHMEGSCLHSLNQERDSIKRHLFKCATECRKSLTNTYRQKNKHSLCVSVMKSRQYEIQILAQGNQRKSRRFCFYIGSFLFLNFILNWIWDHCGALTSKKPDGFFTYAVEYKDKILSQCLRLLGPDGSISLLAHCWQRNSSFYLPAFQTETDGSENPIQRLNIPPWEPCNPTKLRH